MRPGLQRILIFLVSIFPFLSFGQKVISWGAQGNGTYKNPVLNAHYPDIDIEYAVPL